MSFNHFLNRTPYRDLSPVRRWLAICIAVLFIVYALLWWWFDKGTIGLTTYPFWLEFVEWSVFVYGINRWDKQMLHELGAPENTPRGLVRLFEWFGIFCGVILAASTLSMVVVILKPDSPLKEFFSIGDF